MATPTDYKQTLQLPKTAFPMRANLAQREPEQQAHWEACSIQKTWLRQAQDVRTEKKSSAPAFIVHDGPPYANGSIHLGHAVNKILKDIVNKSQYFSGMIVSYTPGWDCHGLPIELNVEKKETHAAKTSASFQNQCRHYAKEQFQQQRIDFKRLGVIAHWDKPYLTMDYDYEAHTIRVLAHLLKDGYIVRGFKPVHWCSICQSALAEAEVEYANKRSYAIDISFVAQNPLDFTAQLGQATTTYLKKGIPLWLPIWTTTPWTLTANQSLAIHPDEDYAVVHLNWQNKAILLVCAETCLADRMTHYSITDHRIITRVKGAVFQGMRVYHPLESRTVPVLTATHVTVDAGTGIVHTAPAHGEDDYRLGQRHNLPIVSYLQANGHFKDDAPLVAGHYFLKADPLLIAALEKKGRLLRQTRIEHSYPHCWRHKKPLIFQATLQWFVSLDHNKLRARALDAIECIQWHPEWGKKRMENMLKNRPDWCISRQNRLWGTPMAFLIHKQTGEPHPNMPTIMQTIADHVERVGIQAWKQLSVEDLLPPEETRDYVKLYDTLDVWFDAGVSHDYLVTKDASLTLPLQLYLEGSDQYRGWFQSSLLIGLAKRKQAPYQAVLTHGFTVDAKGHKMSKSLGNTIAPQKVIKQFGADILRLWVASTDYRAEMSLSDEILKGVADIYRRIRNTARFLLANTADFNPHVHQVDVQDCLALDQWIIRSASDLQTHIIEAYDTYHFNHAIHLIHQFCNEKLGHFYLDVIKDRQYTLPKNSRARRSTQTSMLHLLRALTQWIAPVLSFTAEEIHHYFKQQQKDNDGLDTLDLADSIFQIPYWYTFPPPPPGLDVTPTIQQWESWDKSWEALLNVKTQVNLSLESLRAKGAIGSSLQARVVLYADKTLTQHLEKLGEELRFLLLTSEAILKPLAEKPETAIKTAYPGLFLTRSPVEHAKCIRCWHHVKSVGQTVEHPHLCGRCVINITQTEGEHRAYV